MNLTIRWPDKTLPVEIRCAPGVLTALELAAADGLLAMPKGSAGGNVGLGVGGLLLGKRQNGRIEVTRSVEIACTHTLGPAFVLTPEEIEAGRTGKLTASAGVANEAHDSEVVGWYCSKPSGSKTPRPLELTNHDRVLFDALCPQLWQVALLIRPHPGNTMTAAFGMREADGFVVGEVQELEGLDLKTADEPFGLPETISDPEPETAALDEPEAEPVPVGGSLFGVPLSVVEERAAKKRKWLLWLAIVLAILAAAAYLPESGISK